MENKKINNTNSIEFDEKNIEEYVDLQVEEYIKNFSIDEHVVDKITLPKNFKKKVNKPFKEYKKEKRKNFRYTVIDIFIVCLVLLPVSGVINPNIFKKSPTVYPIFKNINKMVQIDNLKSIIALSNNEVIEGNKDTTSNTIYIEEANVKKPKSNNEAIKLVHSLANTLVEADYKWECSEVTPKTIKKALEGVEKIDDSYDRMHLRNCLRKWSNGDFSNAVNVHNYVWEMLGGNVGKAETLDNKVINSILSKYYQTKELKDGK